MDKHAPVKVVKERPNEMEWITEELKKKIEARNSLKSQLEKNGGNSNQWKGWKQFRNKVNKEIKHAKREHMKVKISRRLENSKSMWDGVKNFLGWRSEGAPDILVNKKGEVLQSPDKISEEIQDAFQSKLNEVQQCLGDPAGNYLKTLCNMTRTL